QRVYRAIAFLLLNSVIVFIVLNVAACLRERARAEPDPHPAAHRMNSYQRETIDLQGYEGVGPDEVSDVLDDFANLEDGGFVYEQWIEFSEPPFDGKRVHVVSPPIGPPERCVPGAREQASKTVFLFGGSTTFGYHAADEWTIAAYLQQEYDRRLSPGRVRVVNLGHGFFYSSQELALLEWLLRAGRVPSSAIFIDGINDPITMTFGLDRPVFTERTQMLWRGAQFLDPTPWSVRSWSWLPLVRFLDSERRRPALLAGPHGAGALNRTGAGGDGTVAGRRAAELYRRNVRSERALCEAYGVACTFVIQP